MSNVLNRNTKQLLTSVNTPDYPDPPWLQSPDLSSVSGVPNKYWKLTGDTITEMDQSEKDAVDQATLRDWRFYCDTEGQHYCGQYDYLGPTQCPNAHTALSSIYEQPGSEQAPDENGVLSRTFITSGGTIVAKVVSQ